MIIPAIDLLAGKTVRLFKGDYSKTTFYDPDPSDLVQSYSNSGVDWIHIVDLEGARDPSKRQFKLINDLVSESGAQIQTGGGIRSEQDIAKLLEIGIGRVVLGSRAINEPATVRDWLDQFGPDKIVLALDVTIDDQGNKWLPTHGWRQESGKRLEDTIDFYLEGGIKNILCTDISRDGTLVGPNIKLYRDLVQQYPGINIQASGGVGTLDDIKTVAKTGVVGCIIGKALLDGKFSMEEASACWLAE